ncbi:MAG: FadR family transcriptional regulator [Rhodobiaceae bacterium]|nr:FadR family transcriptional regulator [Rhodobiaceae bacterium]MCC0056872.1 FadR family transcriptional regulator [Rhodobiaceae bacterium]
MPSSVTDIRFVPLAGSDYSDGISGQIRSHIAKGNLRVGDRLPAERELARQLNVSRNTVRQALRSLSKLGLLEIRKGTKGGAYVKDDGGVAVLSGFTDMYAFGSISPGHLTEVRILVCSEVVRLACERRTDEELIALELNVSAAENLALVGDREGRMAVNLEFYRILAAMTRNPILMTLTEAVHVILTKFIVSIGGPTTNEYVMPLRAKLMRAIRQRDADLGVEAVREHLSKLHAHYLETLSD